MWGQYNTFTLYFYIYCNELKQRNFKLISTQLLQSNNHFQILNCQWMSCIDGNPIDLKCKTWIVRWNDLNFNLFGVQISLNALIVDVDNWQLRIYCTFSRQNISGLSAHINHQFYLAAQYVSIHSKALWVNNFFNFSPFFCY